jgi:general secretion pathway protein G
MNEPLRPPDQAGAPGIRRDGRRGFTLIELLAVVVIIGIVSALVYPKLVEAVNKARYARAIADIGTIHKAIETYRITRGSIPLTMNDMVPQLYTEPPIDPWGQPYNYNNFTQIPPGERRKDGPLVPINKEFDIFSSGPDGQSVPNIHAVPSRDDVLFANDGGFIDVASEY